MTHEDDRECSRLLREQAQIACACAAHLRRTIAHDKDRIIAFEHSGDAVEAQLGELLDRAFILRHDKAQLTALAYELDDVIDRMRKVAEHVAIHRPVFTLDDTPHLPQPALRLLDIIVEMTGKVETQIALFSVSPLALDEIVAVDLGLQELESEADHIFHESETGLVHEYRGHKNVGVDRMVDYLALKELYKMLEQVTDSANHCGSRVKSMARQEA
ncbi:MAG: DUF47 family protein [Patescibacteria group bacterium]